MPDIGFVNGRFRPLAETVVSVEDRGFQFGDGVYEVIRTYGGLPFQLQAHLERLERSARAVELAPPFDLEGWASHVAEGLRRAAYPESKVYIQLTRGAAPREHAFPASASPTAVLTVRELRPLDPALGQRGVAVITVEDLRWGRCDVKSLNLLPNVLARQQAQRAGVFEALFVGQGRVYEGATSNLFLVRDGTLVTPQEGSRILSGVTRAVVLELARKEGMPIEERSVPVAELAQADEVFLTGTTIEIIPVVSVSGKTVAAGKPGPLTIRLMSRFEAFCRQHSSCVSRP
jgi:D-alanine transaminase